MESEKFESTDIVVKTTPSGKKYNRNSCLIATKDQGGLFDLVIDEEFSLLKSLKFTDNKIVSGRLQVFKKHITHEDIIGESKQLNIYQEYELGHASLIANALAATNAVEIQNHGTIIYLKKKKTIPQCRLRVYRDSFDRVVAHFYRVFLFNQWNPGDSVFCRDH